MKLLYVALMASMLAGGCSTSSVDMDAAVKVAMEDSEACRSILALGPPKANDERWSNTEFQTSIAYREAINNWTACNRYARLQLFDSPATDANPYAIVRTQSAPERFGRVHDVQIMGRSSGTNDAVARLGAEFGEGIYLGQPTQRGFRLLYWVDVDGELTDVVTTSATTAIIPLGSCVKITGNERLWPTNKANCESTPNRISTATEHGLLLEHP